MFYPQTGQTATVVRMGTAAGRWVIAATVLGSGVAFLDSTVVNVALPAISKDLHTGVAGLQWVVDAYLVTLTALLLLGGAAGDRFGRKRVFCIGLVAFGLASVGCALAPNATALAIARAVEGVGGAFLVPGSLAIIAATFAQEDRGRAVGAWSGLSGISTAIGPFAGGWLIQVWSWRLVFLINVPIVIVTLLITLKHVPETREANVVPLDVVGAVLASVGLATACWALIEGPSGVTTSVVVAGVVAVVSFVAFFAYESRVEHPMLPLKLFKNRQFSGANATTLAVYAALGAATFLLVLEFQLALGYSPLEAGATLLPVTFITLALSSRMGALSQKIGARIPMTVGPFVVAIGMLLFARIHPGSTYWSTIFPAMVVFGLGLAITVAPLTSTVMGSVDADELGVASGVNNAVARLAGLLSVAILPAVIGLDTTAAPLQFTNDVAEAMRISAVLAALGGVIAFLTVRTVRPVQPVTQAALLQPCADPCLVQAS
jgi:EmrB/QacA subfamily drug resistance transporter